MNYEDLAAKLREEVVQQSSGLKANIDHMQEKAREHIDKGEEADYYLAKSTIDVNTALMDELSSRLIELAEVQPFLLPDIKSCQSVDKFEVLCKAWTHAPITKGTEFKIEFTVPAGMICMGSATRDNIHIKGTGKHAIRDSELILVKDGILISMQNFFRQITFQDIGPILTNMWDKPVVLDVPDHGRRDFGVLDGHILRNYSSSEYHELAIELNSERDVPIPIHNDAKIYTNSLRSGIWITIDRENNLLSHIISERRS